MPTNLEHRSITLSTAEDIIETPQTPIIVAGGPSSSNLLNDLKENFVHDVVLLDQRTTDLAAQLSMAQTVFNTQLDTLIARMSSITARIPAASGAYIADFFTQDFNTGSNTAEINNDYGQATLPILSSQEKLVGRDTKGNVWIPKGAQLSYSYTTQTPVETDWLPDDNGVFALDQRADSAWWRSRATSGQVWIRVRVPSNLNANRLANCIILHPYPTLYSDLASVEYKNSAGVWTAVDLSYLLGWNPDLGRVQWYGNVRIWIPQTQVTELRIKIITPQLWGFSRVSLQQVEFSPTATCVADFSPNFPLGTLSDVVVHGKDPDSLSFLATSVAGALVSVFLTQNSSNSSPVLTGVEVTNS